MLKVVVFYVVKFLFQKQSSLGPEDYRVHWFQRWNSFTPKYDPPKVQATIVIRNPIKITGFSLKRKLRQSLTEPPRLQKKLRPRYKQRLRPKLMISLPSKSNRPKGFLLNRRNSFDLRNRTKRNRITASEQNFQHKRNLQRKYGYKSKGRRDDREINSSSSPNQFYSYRATNSKRSNLRNWATRKNKLEIRKPLIKLNSLLNKQSEKFHHRILSRHFSKMMFEKCRNFHRKLRTNRIRSPPLHDKLRHNVNFKTKLAHRKILEPTNLFVKRRGKWHRNNLAASHIKILNNFRRRYPKINEFHNEPTIRKSNMANFRSGSPLKRLSPERFKLPNPTGKYESRGSKIQFGIVGKSNKKYSRIPRQIFQLPKTKNQPTGYLLKRKPHIRGLDHNKPARTEYFVTLVFRTRCGYLRRASQNHLYQKIKGFFMEIHKELGRKARVISISCTDKLRVNTSLPIMSGERILLEELELFRGRNFSISNITVSYQSLIWKNKNTFVEKLEHFEDVNFLSIILSIVFFLVLVVIISMTTAQCSQWVKIFFVKRPLHDLSRYSEDEVPRCMKEGYAKKGMVNPAVYAVPGFLSTIHDQEKDDCNKETAFDLSDEEISSDWSTEIEFPRYQCLPEQTYAIVNKNLTRRAATSDGDSSKTCSHEPSSAELKTLLVDKKIHELLKSEEKTPKKGIYSSTGTTNRFSKDSNSTAYAHFEEGNISESHQKPLATSFENLQSRNIRSDELVPLYQCQSLNHDYDFVAYESDEGSEVDFHVNSACLTRRSPGQDGRYRIETDM